MQKTHSYLPEKLQKVLPQEPKSQLLEGQEGQDECKHQDWSQAVTSLDGGNGDWGRKIFKSPSSSGHFFFPFLGPPETVVTKSNNNSMR